MNWSFSMRIMSPTWTLCQRSSTDLPLRRTCDFRLLTCESLRCLCCNRQTQDKRIIDSALSTLSTTRAAHKIVVGIFDGRKEEDTDERHGSGDWRQGRDERDELQYQKAQEIEIGQPLELLDQVHRHKRQQRVLGRLDVVVLHKTPQHKRQTVYD